MASEDGAGAGGYLSFDLERWRGERSRGGMPREEGKLPFEMMLQQGQDD